jgi:hypothetical protein
MLDRFAEVSPLTKARLAGFLYLLVIVTGIWAELYARGNVALTINLIGTACYAVVTLLLYDLLRPVNNGLSLLAALFSLTGCAITVLGFLHVGTFGINPLVFYGPYCLLLAYLIFKSTFMPRFIGLLLILPGIGWLTFVSPELGRQLFKYTVWLGLIGEGGLTLSLIIYGVNPQRWREQAARN